MPRPTHQTESGRANLDLQNQELFTDPELGLEQARPSDQGSGLTAWEQPVTLSTPERAILETLDELPRIDGFGIIDATFESLANLRPRHLTALLRDCRSVKVKRLFFLYADKHAHAWCEHLDP